MRVPVEIQVWRLSVLFLTGVATNVFFHFFRAFRSVFRAKAAGYHALDVLVALLTLAAIGAVVFVVNWGEVRLYVPLSLTAGFLLCNALAGDILYTAARSAFLAIRRTMRWVRCALIEPSKRAVRKTFAWLSSFLFPRIPPPSETPGMPPGVPRDPPPKGQP